LLVTNDYAGNQLYFLISAITLCIVPSLVLIEKLVFEDKVLVKDFSMIQRIDKGRLSTLILTALGGGALASATWIFFENRQQLIGDLGRAFAPTLLLIISLALAIFVYFRGRRQNLKFQSIFIAISLAVSFTSTSLGIAASLIRGPIYADNQGYAGFGKSFRESPGAVSANFFDAANWVKKNTDPNVRFFTNRQCYSPKSRYDDCIDSWAYASGVTKRQFLIEGGGWVLKDNSDLHKMNVDQIVSLRFSLSPNLNDLNYLWSKGIRWGWIDKIVIDRSDWLSLALGVYENEDIAIIKLVDPSKFISKSN
jgi:hypothetical protein